jgi:hypothetical protein
MAVVKNRGVVGKSGSVFFQKKRENLAASLVPLVGQSFPIDPREGIHGMLPLNTVYWGSASHNLRKRHWNRRNEQNLLC